MHQIQDNRYVEHGIDFFGVHVLDYCAYGCSKKSKVEPSHKGVVLLNGLDHDKFYLELKKQREKYYKKNKASIIEFGHLPVK